MNHLMKQAQRAFRDKIIIRVQGGTGGPGLPKYGGVGGKGGDVYVVGSKYLDKFDDKKGWFTATNGQPALRTRLLGESGRDLKIRVPLGVTISDEDGQILGEINKPQDKVIAALGGRGGDKFNDGHGFEGQKRTLKLDLKLISDAVFVGFPNAGKSTLLRSLSNAQPRVAEYPFTTIRPHLGIVKYHDYRCITMADLPGLIEGAHKNVGIGHEFLKHMVRSRMLIFVIDVNPVDLGPNYPMRDPLEVLCILNKEIEIYDDTILRKPAILVVNKVDSSADSSELMRKFNKFVSDYEKLHSSDKLLMTMKEQMRPNDLIRFKYIIPISALKRRGLDELKKVARTIMDEEEEFAKLDRDKFTKFSDIQGLENNMIL